MNSYEEKKQRRIDYYNEKAEKFEQQSSQLAHESSKMVEAIPMGQPLLVDHHSYKSDKNYRDRAWGKMEKSVEAGQKADYYRSKAEAAEKIEATALYLRELDAEAKAAKEEADRMLARVKSMQKRSDYLKAMLLDALHATGKVKTGRVTVSIRTTQAVAVDEGANLPEAYTTVKTTVSPNKVAIKQALLDGVEVPGCSLEARESVSIR